jgi:hypothetical protein
VPNTLLSGISNLTVELKKKCSYTVLYIFSGTVHRVYARSANILPTVMKQLTGNTLPYPTQWTVAFICPVP